MRVPAFPIVASLVLLAAPAFAQSSTTTGTSTEQSGVTTPTMGTSTEQSGVTAPATGWHHGMGVSTDTKEKIRQSLEQTGFKNVSVTPEAFVIRGQAPDGSHVVKLVRPDEMTGVIESGSSSEPNISTNSGSSTSESGTNR